MRVVFLATHYPSAVDPVTCVFHRTACNALARQGVDVKVIAPTPYVPPGMRYIRRKWRTYAALPVTSMVDGIPVRRPRCLMLPKGNLWCWNHHPFTRMLGREINAGVDLIHAHFAYPSGVAAARIGRQQKIPTVLTLHGSDVNCLPFVSERTRRMFVEAVIQADEVIAVSEALADKTHSLSGRRPRVIPIGLDLRRFVSLPGRTSARRELGLPADKFILLCVGSLVAAKGVREVLAAMSRMVAEGIVAVLVGDGTLRSEVAATPGAVAVGPVRNDQIPTFLAASDVMVLASYGEGMPTVLVEAGAAGLPVIGTRVGGIPELLGENRGWLIQEKSVDAIISAVRTVIQSRGEARSRVLRLKEYVHRHYDADRNARQLVEVYRDAIAFHWRAHEGRTEG